MTKGIRMLIIILIAVPALEIWGLIQAGKWIGAWQTFALILLTGCVGAYLAKREGYKVLKDVRERLQSGDTPGIAMLDGVCVFAGGLFLLIPGFFTDVLGLLLLLPPTRRMFRNSLLNWLRKAVSRGRFRIFMR